ncbi:hypothetical protein K7432_003189 [Basidiobolus ranarum]|uniref:BZIP domain-containing protein n=1 Tax=Basidiobolus ranarum TaxID=34480 RepID=A0ABR2X092_9FUNG
MNSLKETATQEHLFSTNEEHELDDTILDQMLKLTDSQASEAEGSRILSESLNHLEALDNASSSKLYREDKLDILNGDVNQPFFDCTEDKMVPVSDAILNRISQGSSYVSLAESPTNSDSPISPLSMQSRNDGFNLPWDSVQGFTATSHMIPPNSMYQYSNYDPHSLISRRASLPENDITHFTEFPDTSNGRKRVVSWADLDSHSFGAKDLERNNQHTSQTLYARRFSLHLPVQSNNTNSKFYYPNNVFSEDYGATEMLQKSSMDINLRNQMNFPISHESLTKTKVKPHPYQVNHMSKPKEQRSDMDKGFSLKGEFQTSTLSAKSDKAFDMLDEYSDSNIDAKEYDQEEEPSNQSQQPPQTVVERRLSRRRERNRLAARRSREKRNQFLRELEQLNQSLNNENGTLKASLCEALRELQMLRAANPNSATASSTHD